MPNTSSAPAQLQLTLWLQLVAAVTGVFLIAAYLSGRLYLDAYYKAFHADSSSFGLSVQDVMFEGRWSLVSPIMITVTMLAFLPFYRLLIRKRESLDSIHAELQELLQRHRENEAATRYILDRHAAGELPPEELDRRLKSLHAEHVEVDRLATDLLDQSDSIDADIPTPPRILWFLRPVLHRLEQNVGLAWTYILTSTLLAILGGAGIFLISLPVRGATSSAYTLASFSAFSPVFVFLVLLLRARRA